VSELSFVNKDLSFSERRIQLKRMAGKKFITLFLGLIVISAIGLTIWIKQGYDSRPAASVESDKITESCAAAGAIVNQYIELDRNGKTMTSSAEKVNLSRDSVVAACREVSPDEVEIVVSHAVYGSLAIGFTKEEVETVLKNDPKQAQSRISVVRLDGTWKMDPSTVYGPHISVETAKSLAK
jgi:hypothetical protein